ncbi:MAG: phage holin family protein [Bacteroidales bacterium]|nr:phage holin family protein [Bacteroidales bacterium]MCD8394723.1 phage holin family protein [Bacteroidales bacterium]
MPKSDNNHPFQQTWTMVTRLGRLYVESARLMVAEKLSRLLSGIALAMISFILGICFLVFVSLCVGRVLTELLPDYWSYLIIGGFYLLLIALLVVFRQSLLVNPIARFISRIVVEPPKTHTHDEQDS